MTNPGPQAELVRRSLKRRYRKERRFRCYGIAAISIALFSLVILFTDIVSKGYTGFIKTTVTLEVHLDGELMYLSDASDPDQIAMADFQAPIIKALQEYFPQATSRADKRELSRMTGSYASNQVRDLLTENPGWLGSTRIIEYPAHDTVSVYVKHAGDPGYS
ncbi:MAG: DUF3333 domain-containing protein, partial [Marinobacter sp.]|uniref:DUF3333 domain-containing protein n=1 Tax=Marinobacter sp. TaxID=50741 RepID=UPI001B4A3E68